MITWEPGSGQINDKAWPCSRLNLTGALWFRERAEQGTRAHTNVHAQRLLARTTCTYSTPVHVQTTPNAGRTRTARRDRPRRRQKVHATRKKTTASYGEGKVAAHLGVLGDDVDHPGVDGDEPDGVGEEEVQRRASTARGRFIAPPANLQEGNGEDEVQERMDERTLKENGRRR